MLAEPSATAARRARYTRGVFSPRPFPSASLLVLVLAGCARGADTIDVGEGGSGEGGQGGEGGLGGASATSGLVSASSASSSSVSSSSTSSASSASSGTGSGGQGGEGGEAGTTCDATTSCQSADELPKVAGDQEAETQTASDHKSRWLRIKIQEDHHALPQGLKFTASLSSPSGNNFDLFVYPGTADGPDCTVSPTKATPSGSTDTVSMAWSESSGSDDSRWMTLEVRHVGDAPCSPSEKWTLLVEGNKE